MKCEKCKYYVAHYMKKKIYFVKCSSSHCTAPKRKKSTLKENCDYFIKHNEAVENLECQRSIEYCLTTINEKLDILNTYFFNKE